MSMVTWLLCEKGPVIIDNLNTNRTIWQFCETWMGGQSTLAFLLIVFFNAIISSKSSFYMLER